MCMHEPRTAIRLYIWLHDGLISGLPSCCYALELMSAYRIGTATVPLHLCNLCTDIPCFETRSERLKWHWLFPHRPLSPQLYDEAVSNTILRSFPIVLRYPPPCLPPLVL